MIVVWCSCSTIYDVEQDLDPIGDLENITALMIGTAKVNITPPFGQGIELSGFGGRVGNELKGIHDDIYGRIVIIKDDKSYFVEISVDLLGFSGVKALVEQMNADGIEIPVENYMIAATHNHAGPSVYIENAGTAQYQQDMLKALTEGIKEAYNSMQPGNMKTVKVEAPFTLYHNRQEINPFTGQCKIGKDPDGISDKEVIVKEYYNADVKSIASTLLVAVHSTILGEFNYHVSGDFAGYTSRYLEKHRSDNHVSLWMMGGGGDQSPRHWHQRSDAFLDPKRGPEALGNELGEAIIAELDKAELQTGFNIVAETFTTDLPLKAGGTHGRIANIVMLNANTVIIGVPYELFSSTTMEIKKMSPIANTLVQSVTNGKDAYLPTPESYGFNCYENRSGKHFATHAEQVFVQIILKKIDEIKSRFEEQI